MGRFVVAWGATLGYSAMAVGGIRLISPAVGWTRWAQPWAHRTLSLLGVDADIEGGEYLRGPAVFVANHQTMVDVILLPAILPRTVKFVAKQELKRIPLWGQALSEGGGIIIDRGRPRDAVARIRDGLRQLPAGWSVAIFPEGTRSKTGRVGNFKAGAFHIAMATGLPMVPIGLAGGQDLVPQGDVMPQRGRAFVTVGSPILTHQWDEATLGEHMAQVRRAVVTCAQASARRRQAARAEVGLPADSDPLLRDVAAATDETRYYSARRASRRSPGDTRRRPRVGATRGGRSSAGAA